MIKALIVLAVSRANISALTATAEAATIFGGLDDIPPDHVRVPVSVYRVAQELGLPYETTRRHVAGLKTAGLCLSADGGLIVPRSAFQSAVVLRAVERNFGLTTHMLLELGSVGVTSSQRSTFPAVDFSRQTARLCIEYFLDALCLMARTMKLDFVDVLLLRAAALGNVDRLVHKHFLRARSAGLHSDQSDRRRPASAYAVAAFTLMPYETVRRRMNRLVMHGALERAAPGGYVVPPAVIPGLEGDAGTTEFARLTEMFFAKLSSIGLASPADLAGHERRAAATRT
jgi:hypothetical protein